ncbi:hypothetical protein J4204_06665 [Candidatus Woesearchaeota archaeon]|nr:hypothetical protein [Candidatus Woesearchaeota archaeon]
MESFIMNATTVLTGISTIFLLGLLYVYYKNLKQAKSKFTIGLFLFALLFLAQNLVSLYYYITMMEYYAPEVEVHVFILTLLQAIGFMILLKITWE